MGKTSLDMSENIEGLLCYALTWISGIVFLLIEKENKFVRFHALQSIFTFLPLTVLSYILHWIPFIGWLLGSFIGILGFILWIVLMIKAYNGEEYRLPIIGDLISRDL
jgi:uncharacterized membrane protein